MAKLRTQASSSQSDNAMNEMTLSRTRPVLPSPLKFVFARRNTCWKVKLILTHALPLSHPERILARVGWTSTRVNSVIHREAAFGNYTPGNWK